MIKTVRFFELLDTAGVPVVTAFIILHDGTEIQTSAPSQTILPKTDQHLTRYQGRGVIQCINHNTPIFQNALYNKNLSDVDPILSELKELGTNFTSAISIACMQAEARLNNQPLYAHLSSEGFVKPKLIVDITDQFSLVPLSSKPLFEQIRSTHDTIFILQDILLEKRLSLADPLLSHQDKIELILQSIEEAGQCLGRDMGIFADFTNSVLFTPNNYTYNNQVMDIPTYVEQRIDDLNSYPLVGMISPMHPRDLLGQQYFQSALAQQIKRQVVISQPIIPGYEGTISETLETITQSKAPVIIKGESSFCADFAVGIQASFVKFGNINKTDCYNRFLEIEHYETEYLYA